MLGVLEMGVTQKILIPLFPTSCDRSYNSLGEYFWWSRFYNMQVIRIDPFYGRLLEKTLFMADILTSQSSLAKLETQQLC